MSRPDYLKKIENRILSMPEGAVFITSDFLDMADTQAINKALSRLAADGTIRRVVRGVYDRPAFSELLQEQAAPDMDQIAKAIARNFGWSIVPCGDTALNLLGLSAQVPAVWQYVSDGPYRKYMIGNRALSFKHGANKDVSGLSDKFALVVQALKALGKDSVDALTMEKLASILNSKERLAFLNDTQHRTAWINRIAKELYVMGETE
jgi:hypothetical protein